MPWIRVTETFDWQPRNARWSVNYKAGNLYLVKNIVAEVAIREGKAVPAERPTYPARPDAVR